MSAYLDASVLLPILIEEPASQAVDAYILAGAQEFLVSDFAAAEVASALSRLSPLEALDAAARISTFGGRRRVLRPTSLAIARRLHVRLVTLDRRLAAAAREPDVAVEEPTS